MVIDSGTIRNIGYGFLLLFYSNFVPKFMKYFTCKYTVTLKPMLGSLKVIGTDTDRSATYDFLLTFHSNHAWAYLVQFPT